MVVTQKQQYNLSFVCDQVREVRGHGQLDFPQRRVCLLELEDSLPGQDDPHLLWPVCGKARKAEILSLNFPYNRILTGCRQPLQEVPHLHP